MASNSLGAEETKWASEEGASSSIDGLIEKVDAGDASALASLFSNDGNATEDNDAFQSLKGKLGEILQSKGMSEAEAEKQAGNIDPGFVDSLKDKFSSSDSADSIFDLDNLNGLPNMTKGLFK